MPERILLDTDIGSDIDDAVCLAYLLAQPACDLLGITTVTGEATKRAMLASALCRVAGADVPIRPGAEDTLDGRPSPQALAHQADRVAGWPHETEFPEGDAVDFLARTIRAHPGEVTLLTIGPLTNAALLLDFAAVWFAERDGIYFHDPLAAATVFDGEVCGFTRGEVTVAADGTTGWRPRADGPHEVATSVVPDRFFAGCFGLF
ncbi:nucleoside hydrolase [Phytohabitans suffuscus]|uniref:Inosine/uridine-preferring nucleoside hydrolase domain-containing protein n=1 Tax=Phytohabitans suffuscus TaxID=624315 RepID=A0A6F8YQ84_9ACTN|nr:nucleoside hydrolase [Phytohabitans suffuscus]BCB88068.1 hypothetical protein Psuf_053810 [Phytohabitans suffuscus]